jgi:hypothetical protein
LRGRDVGIVAVAVAAAGLAAGVVAHGRGAPRKAPVAANPAASLIATRAPGRTGVPTLRGKRFFCGLPPGATRLPAGRLRGLAHHLRQYPVLALATRRQTAAARRMLTTLETAAARWRSPKSAAAAGFDMHTAVRATGDTSPHYLHAESRRFADDGRYLDPRRPEALIFANTPGRRLVLIGVMFSMPRGIQGPSPAGPIARWHFHRVCAKGSHRGLKPLPDGSCPPGETLGEGSEMLHVWFTHDLRSAYAIHAPEPDLCSAHLLPRAYCAGGLHIRGM